MSKHADETGCGLTREDFHPDGDEPCVDGGEPDDHPGPFKPGDMALHKNGQLDARPVHGVSTDGSLITLRIGDHVTDPLPAENYTNAGDVPI